MALTVQRLMRPLAVLLALLTTSLLVAASVAAVTASVSVAGSASSEGRTLSMLPRAGSETLAVAVDTDAEEPVQVTDGTNGWTLLWLVETTAAYAADAGQGGHASYSVEAEFETGSFPAVLP